MGIELKLEGLDKLNRKLAKAVAQLPREKTRFLQQEAQIVEARAKLLTPVDTGRLRAGFFTTMNSPEEAVVANNVSYAAHV